MGSRVEKKLKKLVGRANRDFDLIGEGDRVMVAMSGGKDSYALLHLLRQVQRIVPFEFSLIAVNLDQGQPGFPAHVIEDYLKAQGVEYRMLQRDTYSVVVDKIAEGKTYCSLCSRLRRGILYDAAVELGCTKIALGHHADDTVETLLLNLFYAGQLKAMPPRLRSDDGRNVVIRPLILCQESDLALLAEEQAFPVIPCDLCGSQDNLYRKRVKALIDTLQADNDKVRSSLLAALGNVRPTHLLDRELSAKLGLLDPVGNDEALGALGSSGCGLPTGA